MHPRYLKQGHWTSVRTFASGAALFFCVYKLLGSKYMKKKANVFSLEVKFHSVSQHILRLRWLKVSKK